MENDLSNIMFGTEGTRKKCTVTECTDENGDYLKFQCNNCKRWVHFKCTRLPMYQIQLFLTSGTKYSKYVCVSCVNVSKGLYDLTNKMKVDKCEELYREKYEKQLERSSKYEGEIILLNNKLKEKEKEIGKLRTEIQAFETRYSNLLGQTKRRKIEEDSAELKDQEIERLMKENEDLSEWLNERETVLDDTRKKLEDMNSTNLEEIENRFKIMQEDFKSFIDEKLNFHNHLKDKGTLPYAPEVSGDISKEVNDKNQMDTYQSLMLSKRNEEIAEEHEKKSRSCNIIIHGRKETENSPEYLDDTTFIDMLIHITNAKDLKPKSIQRIGTYNCTKIRPIKVIFSNEKDKETIMKSLGKLKGKQLFQKITITDDYTLLEREMIKHLRIKASERNSSEPENSLYVWRLRGRPKTGLVLKRIKKHEHSLEESRRDITQKKIISKC